MGPNLVRNIVLKKFFLFYYRADRKTKIQS